MLQYDHEKRSKKLTEHGVIRDKDLVVIPIAPPEGKKEPKDINWCACSAAGCPVCAAVGPSGPWLSFLLVNFFSL